MKKKKKVLKKIKIVQIMKVKSNNLLKKESK